MSNCPECHSEGYKSFTFSTGETITLCRACGDESGHEALRQGSCNLPWTQAAHDFDEQYSRWLPPKELKRQTDLPASGAAEKIRSTEEVRKLALVWEARPTTANPWGGRHYEREITYFDVLPLGFILLPDIPVVAREVCEDRSPADVTTSTTPAELKRLAWLRTQRKRAWKSYVLRKYLPRWKAAIKDRKESLDSPFCRSQIEKRVKRLAHFWKSREAFPLPNLPVYKVDRVNKLGWLLPKFTCRQPIEINHADARMNQWLADLDNGKPHESAGCGAEELKHECKPHCTCGQDWRPHVTWRPWENPRLNPKDIECLECDFPFLTLRLQRILRWNGSTYPLHLHFREKPIFFQVRIDAEKPDPSMAVPLSLMHRRFQLCSWINGIPQPHKYAKAYECFDFKARISIKPGQLPHDTYPLRKGSARWKVHLDYEIVTRERRREVRIDPPRYKTHDSWRDIMAYKGCSRRTAFRLIEKGFRIPEFTAQSTA